MIVFWFSFLVQFAIHNFAQQADQINIFPLIISTDIVSFTIFACMKNTVDTHGHNNLQTTNHAHFSPLP